MTDSERSDAFEESAESGAEVDSTAEIMNEAVANSKKIAARVKIRGKRTLGRSASYGSGAAQVGVNVLAPHVGLSADKVLREDRRLKNSRRSRGMYGRGLAKKGGGGGKGTWGKPGSELERTHKLDKRDPNYDSEEAEDGDIVLVASDLLPQDIIERVSVFVKEFFEHGDTKEVVLSLRELKLPDDALPLVVYSVVQTAMDSRRANCELASQLLADLYAEYLEEGHYEDGFTKLLSDINDLQLDCPDASHVLGNFMARCVADDCMAPMYLREMKQVYGGIVSENTQRQNSSDSKEKSNSPAATAVALASANLPNEEIEKKTECGMSNGVMENGSNDSGHNSGNTSNEELASAESGLRAIQRANNLLTSKHGLVRLDTIWGVGGGVRPVKVLSRKVHELVCEYLMSNDINEAMNCLHELEVPHFHHEAVYWALDECLEANGGNADKVLALLKAMSAANGSMMLPPDQMRLGFERIYVELPDIHLDVPEAFKIMNELVDKAANMEIIDEKLALMCPQRGRKRFVSEGDGGKIKA